MKKEHRKQTIHAETTMPVPGPDLTLDDLDDTDLVLVLLLDALTDRPGLHAQDLRTMLEDQSDT